MNSVTIKIQDRQLVAVDIPEDKFHTLQMGYLILGDSLFDIKRQVALIIRDGCPIGKYLFVGQNTKSLRPEQIRAREAVDFICGKDVHPSYYDSQIEKSAFFHILKTAGALEYKNLVIFLPNDQ